MVSCQRVQAGIRGISGLAVIGSRPPVIRALAVFRKLFLPVADQLAQYWIARTDLRTLTNPALAKLGRGTPDREGTYIANGLAGPPAFCSRKQSGSPIWIQMPTARLTVCR
jgi:hypothetical protein